jgi:hypothetical protein
MIKSTIDHQIVNSFLQYIDWQLVDKGRAFENVTVDFYPIDNNNKQIHAYASPYKSIVYDNGVSGVAIFSGVSGHNASGQDVFYTRASGLNIDYRNGQVSFSQNPRLSNIQGTFALKDFNVEYTSRNEENLLMETKFVKNPEYAQLMTGLNEKMVTFPIVFVSYSPGQNEPHAIGGMDETKPKFTLYAIMDNVWNLDGVLSIFRDLKNTSFGLLTDAETPINVSGDLKNLNYTYTGIVNGKTWPNAIFINNVSCSKLTPEANYAFGNDVFIGIADVECGYYRFPRN